MTRAGVESWGEREILRCEQVVSNFIIFGRKLDEDRLGRGTGLHPCKAHRAALVFFIDGEFCPINTMHFTKEFELRKPSGGSGVGFGHRAFVGAWGEGDYQEVFVQPVEPFRRFVYRHEQTCNTKDVV